MMVVVVGGGVLLEARMDKLRNQKKTDRCRATGTNKA